MNRSSKMLFAAFLLLAGNAFAQADVVWFNSDINSLNPAPGKSAKPKPVTATAPSPHIRLALSDKYVGDTSVEIKGTLYYSVEDRKYEYPIDLSLDQGQYADIGHLVYFAELQANNPSNLLTIKILKRGVFIHDTVEQVIVDLNQMTKVATR